MDSMEVTTTTTTPVTTTTANTTGMEIVDYSEKSFAVYGDTKDFKTQLKDFGGRFNRYLKIDGETQMGWVFSKKRQEEVAEFVLQANAGEIESNTTIPTLGGTGMPTISNPKTNTYQFVKFKVYKPHEGQKVQLKVDGKTVDGLVTKTETHNDVVDTAHVEFDGQTSLAVISRGYWAIWGYNAKHSLFFS